jgi:hypothetical protein
VELAGGALDLRRVMLSVGVLPRRLGLGHNVVGGYGDGLGRLAVSVSVRRKLEIVLYSE